MAQACRYKLNILKLLHSVLSLVFQLVFPTDQLIELIASLRVAIWYK